MPDPRCQTDDARPKRLRFLVPDTVGRVVRHTRETLLRCADAIAQAFCDAPPTALGIIRPAPAGE